MRIGKKDIIWSYVAQGLRWGSSLLLLPLVLCLISSEYLAFWYLFTTINSLVMLFDFGFSPTIIRNVAYVFSGTNELLPEGIKNVDKKNEPINGNLLKQIIISSKYIYKIISFLIFLCLSSLGSYYVYRVISENNVGQSSMIWLSWGIMIVNTILSFYYLYFNALLLGRGFVYQNQYAIICSSIITLICSLIGLRLGYGIVALAISALLGTIINRIICRYYFYDKELKDIITDVEEVSSQNRNKLISIIWYNAKKTGCVTMGGFLITRMGMFFVTSFFSLSIAAQYGLTMQIINVISALSTTYMGAIYPKMVSDYYNQDIESVKRHLGRSVVLVFITYFSFSFITIYACDPLLVMIGSKTYLLPKLQIAALFLTYFLESQHGIFSNIHTIKNHVPFVKPALISGGLIIVLIYVSFNYLSPSIWYLIAIQFLVQLAYNNWKWIYDACRELNIGYFDFYYIGFLELRRMMKSVNFNK